MKAKFVGGIHNGLLIDVTDILEGAEFIVIGYSEDYSEVRKEGGCAPRQELDNQPVIEGYLTPMWDGSKLRYETQEIYNTFI